MATEARETDRAVTIAVAADKLEELGEVALALALREATKPRRVRITETNIGGGIIAYGARLQLPGAKRSEDYPAGEGCLSPATAIGSLVQSHPEHFDVEF